MAERRYDDAESAAIFRAAAEGQPTPSREESRDDGLTLAELQVIGREVGIAPDAIARAAATLDIQRTAQTRRWLGLPIGVSRTVDLERMTDQEWERFVVQLREVFAARGRTAAHGALKQWTNGNLQVLLEPTASGQRLRFSTLHGSARASITGGLAVLGAGAIMAVAYALSGELGKLFQSIAVLGLTGVGMIAAGALRLPSWARLRGRQMEELAAHAAHLSDAATGPALPPSGPTPLDQP